MVRINISLPALNNMIANFSFPIFDLRSNVLSEPIRGSTSNYRHVFFCGLVTIKPAIKELVASQICENSVGKRNCASTVFNVLVQIMCNNQ